MATRLSPDWGRAVWVEEAHFGFMSEKLHFPLLVLPVKDQERSLLTWPRDLGV